MSPHILEVYRRQARNNALCNLRLFRACKALTPEAYLAPRASFFGSIHNTLDHILLVDERYLLRLAGVVPGPARAEGSLYLDLESLREARHRVDREIWDRVTASTEADLSKPAVLVDDHGQTVREPRLIVWEHLFHHQVHHRGQVHGLLSQTSVAPPQLDEFFLGIDHQRRVADLAELRDLGFSDIAKA
ncbi:DinB family protein [Sulfidibacter corallicola]|uniref:DinB family protein n=1 Tax=Sulfidibacter corallicola TaxID=2818388 RepID=A0A8A4TFH2_SULCO|nr:DinB family protein [Sulfidibacter corallicola]QTD48383.1 DinB family protein [Sulfidibacter corallicola]